MNESEIKPLDSSDLDAYSEQALEFFISQPLKLTEKFMKKIYADDQFYRQARYALVADARELYLYGCARQVRKASISLVENQDFVKEPPEKELKASSNQEDTLGREVIEAVYDQQNLWIRKLIEILLNLINFQDSNVNEAYRIFLSAENLSLFLGKQKDFKDFYGFASGNVDSSIRDYAERIEDDLKTMASKSIWFLDEKRLKARSLPVFNSTLSRYKRALPLATEDEKLVLGPTYQRFFSMASLSAHGSIGSLPLDINLRTIRSNIAHISILSQHCMSRANSLMGFDEPQSIEKIRAGRSNAPDLMKRYKRRFDVDDLVLAYGDLAEVLEIKESPFGYTSYKVRYLRKPPLPELPEDWLPSEDMVRIVRKAAIREFWNRNLEKFPYKDEANKLLRQSDDRLYEVTKKTFIDLDERGVLIPMLFGKQKTETL
jgi:hypothetical protein